MTQITFLKNYNMNNFPIFQEILPEHITQEEFNSIDKSKLTIVQSPNDGRFHIYSEQIDRYVFQTFYTEGCAIEFINESFSANTAWDPKDMEI